MSPPALSARGVLACAGLAALALWPMLLVTAPMVYFDTAAYASAGRAALEIVFGPAIGAGGDGGASAGPGGGGPGALRAAAWSVALAGLGGMPWGAVLLCWAQAWMTLVIAAALVPDGLPPARLAVAALLLVGATGLPWYAAYAMPDLLGAAVIAYYAVLAGPFARIGTAWRLALGAGAAFAVLGHYGHLPLAAALAVLAVALEALRGRATRWLVLAAAWPLALALATNAGLSVALERIAPPPPAATAPALPSVAPGRLPVLLARSIEDGPARLHLEAACAEDRYSSCALLPDPLPETVGAFLWSAETGIAGLSRAERRILRAEELRIVADAALAHPGLQAAALVRNAARQLTHVGISDHLPRPETGRASMRDRDDHPVLGLADRLVPLSVWAAAAALLVLGVLGRVPRGLGGPILIVAAGLGANAAIYGGLSYPVDRYSGRVAWLLCALALMAAAGAKRIATGRGAATVPGESSGG